MRKVLIVIGGLVLSFVLNACSSAAPAIQYEGKTRQVAEVEEMIGDLLESQNPDLEFTVSIEEQSDTD
jgi:hypothetical protein